MDAPDTTNWVGLVHVLGAAQGIFLAAVLCSGRRGSLPNRILAVVMFAFAVDLGTAAFHTSGLDLSYPHGIGIDYPLALLYGPLIYLYARTLSHRERVFRPAYLWHFVPFALVVLLLVPFYLQSGADKLALLHHSGSHFWTQVLGPMNDLKLVHGIVYVGVTLAFLRNHRRRMRDVFSFRERIDLAWLRNLIVAIAALAAFVVVLYLVGSRGTGPVVGLDPTTTYDDFTLVGLAIFVYVIGFIGLRRPEIFDRREPLAESPDVAPYPHRSTPVRPADAASSPEAPFGLGAAFPSPEEPSSLGVSVPSPEEPSSLGDSVPSPVTPVRPGDAGPSPVPPTRGDADRSSRPTTPSRHGASQDARKPSYARSGLDPEAASCLEEALLAVMERDRPYRRSDLALQDLAEMLAASPHNLTEVINTRLGRNFYDFVNEYRVREVQERLTDRTYEHLTILAIGLEAGFNSKSAFNAVFKKHTRLTPSQFKAQAGRSR